MTVALKGTQEGMCLGLLMSPSAPRQALLLVDRRGEDRLVMQLRVPEAIIDASFG